MFLLLIPILYLITLARGLVLGDPTEYTFVANILGIAHPPGYAFITLVGKLFQTLVPFGDIPWRMHLLSAVFATLAALFIFATIRTISTAIPGNHNQFTTLITLFAALLVGFSADIWQHAIHANPHIITAAFLVGNLFFLTKWYIGSIVPEVGPIGPNHRRDSVNWLLVFCVSAGLGVTHHPLTVFSFPAYALFIVWAKPAILRDWRLLLKMVLCALLGLSIWLYFPIRSAMHPEFGPDTMNTLNGFLDHVLGRGITESLPFFGLRDQLDRLLVFWTLLRLQYSLPAIFLSLLGIGWLWLFGRKSGLHKLGLLFVLTFLCNYLFVNNLRQQDIMAYLLGPFMLVGLLAGIGLYGLIHLLLQRVELERRLIFLLMAALFLLGPGLQLLRNLPTISLADYDTGDSYVNQVFDWFDGSGEGAVLLNDWEHMTPLWYTQFVEDRLPDPADVTPRLVSTDRPWLESVFDFLGGGPVYLSGYRPEIVAAGFRLRPRGPFYQVVEEDHTIPPELTKLDTPAAAGDLEIVAYQLPQTEVTGGEYVPFTLAMRSPVGTADYYVPNLYVGDILYDFTTDSHLITPLWKPGEVIVERFDFALPPDMESGRYPLTLHLRNLSQNEDSGSLVEIGFLDVTAQAFPLQSGRLLANFRQRVGLVSATASQGFDRRTAPWTDDPLIVQSGSTVHLTLEWESLASPEDSYSVFVHLIDSADHPLVTLDYTPLGGSAPTYLWIPKWLPGQRMLDPYRVPISADLSPGTYYLEAGLYEMTSHRRLYLSEPDGSLNGDRYILGPIEVNN
ncbi:MAG: DUF2723 domain-containing protein [Candidatus Promineifilaceae bacterium]